MKETKETWEKRHLIVGHEAGAGGRHLGNERENRKEALDTLSFYRTAFPRTDTEPQQRRDSQRLKLYQGLHGLLAVILESKT